MKRAIEGKRYDTEKARLLVEVSEGSTSDFSHVRYGLYRTPRGMWFIAGRGGPMSRFAQPSGGNSWVGGERIIPLVPADVLELVEGLQDSYDCDLIFEFPEISELIENP
jgi:hypothetical protein